MSTSPHPQARVEAQFPTAPEPIGECSLPTSFPNPVVTPSKRSDDDIQFISSKPVKRRKISDEKPKPTPQKQVVPGILTAPIPPVSAPTNNDTREGERRVSTGMVGLPSDFHAMELTCALRGVSLPVLENFTLDQPFRRPRPASPPELSPKQLPQTISPTMLNINSNHNGPEVFGLHTTAHQPVAYLATNEGPQLGVPTQNSLKPCPDNTQVHVLNMPAEQASSSPSTPTGPPKDANQKGMAMPPPPLPKVDTPRAPDTTRNSPSPSENGPHNVPRANATKQPCQVCAKLRQQANLARAQGVPMMHHGVPHHMMPQVPCHQSYGQHLHPQIMAMAHSGMHPYGAGFAPIMMPVNGNGFAAMPPPHVSSPAPLRQHISHQNTQTTAQPGKSSDQPQPQPQPQPPPQCQPTTTPATSTTTTTTAKSPAVPSSPVKPPASLIQPTYRKHSPNLIVDVAETCQEKFPFEEVARRHNAPVDKVFDVFAAIIQVPLLRCPTDRRRAGRLATARVKEYTRAKRDIQEEEEEAGRVRVAGGGAGKGEDNACVVRPVDIAHRLGQVEFPEGFSL
ncbi:hypothetical protein F4779DRAFT_559249 [Xylariaceae sp. FL0662B]|nr:hypothetical protein F4779DRAFT_559249 [Xylariaceae sp. FL0662B]